VQLYELHGHEAAPNVELSVMAATAQTFHPLLHTARSWDGHPPMRLASHVRACCTGRHIILMDLRRNKYLGLNAADTSAFASVVEDWPLAATSELNTESSETIRELLDTGLLTWSADEEVRPSLPICASQSAALLDGYVDVPTRIGWLDIARFIYAAITAWALLKWRSLEATVDRVTRRRERTMKHAARSNADDQNRIARLMQLTAGFARMRTFLFTAQDHCLFESLALSEYLACYGLTPDWVFGVATQPFSAHCWLQQGDVTVNDTPEHTRAFTPILRV
jgi:hypothetical protein